MAKVKTRKTKIIKQKPAPEKINFEITYKNYEKLARFMNDRAKIIGKKRTGISSKEQRIIAREIKRARHLGLLPFHSRV